MEGAVESLKCSQCGAPLEVTPDSVVAVCRYCGRPNFFLGNPAEVLAVPTLSSSEIVKKAVERTKKDLNLRRRMSAINFTSPAFATRYARRAETSAVAGGQPVGRLRADVCTRPKP